MLMVQKRIFFGSQKHNRQLMCHIAVWFQLSTCQDLVLLLTFYDLEGYKNMCSVATTQASFPQLYLLGSHFFPLLQKKLKKKENRRDRQASTQYISFSLLCQVVRNKKTENRVLNSLGSDQRGSQTGKSQYIFIGLLSPTDNLIMSKNVPLDPRPSSITRATRLRMYCTGYWMGSPW